MALSTIGRNSTRRAASPQETSYNGLTITNGKGRRTGMSDQAGAEAWSYDALGRVLADRRTTSGVTKTFTYAYNLDGSVKSITYPSGRRIDYAYNAAARTLSAVDAANSVNYAVSASYTRLPSGSTGRRCTSHSLNTGPCGGSDPASFCYRRRV